MYYVCVYVRAFVRVGLFTCVYIRWPEKIYGLDGWGHMLQGVRVEEVRVFKCVLVCARVRASLLIVSWVWQFAAGIEHVFVCAYMYLSDCVRVFVN